LLIEKTFAQAFASAQHRGKILDSKPLLFAGGNNECR